MATNNTPLSPREFIIFNRMADKMEALHQWFRLRWNTIYEVANSSQRPTGMSTKNYLNLCLEFCESLEKHHKIEETRVFPFLATRMPAFTNHGGMIAQHEVIHKGLGTLESYAHNCLQGGIDLRWSELKGILDSFGTTLWEHPADEVRQLGAEETQKYWSAHDMSRMPM